MAVELTDEEMRIERRAEEIKQDLLEDFGEFQTWLQEEFALTNKAIVVHAELIKGTGALAGTVMAGMYEDYCEAKSSEQARSEQ